MTYDLGIIGGTGLARLADFQIDGREPAATPWGDPSAPIYLGKLAGKSVAFLPRHGDVHAIPPHRINYRANIAALKSVGVSRIIAVAAVGGITPFMSPARIALPDQLIDYTHGRAGTFFEDGLDAVTHIDFSFPYSETLREGLLDAAERTGLDVYDGGVYGCTQGPRLETAAEIRCLERDGCDLVGMTGMPEAALAREQGIDYACCAVVANWAAGKTDDVITMEEIEHNLHTGMADVARLLKAFLAADL